MSLTKPSGSIFVSDINKSNVNHTHNLTKNDVGLNNVDNTTDLNKPISTATQTALDLKAPKANPVFTGTITTDGVFIKNGGTAPSYFLSQDGTGRQHWYWNTSGSTTPTLIVANEDASDIMMTSQNIAGRGAVFYFRTVDGLGKAAGSSITWTNVLSADMIDFKYMGNTVYTTANLTKSSIGLGNVDNTTDLNKPISTATQTSLNGKANNATTLVGYGITDAINVSQKGIANGVATLGADAKIPATQLPSFVDDVLEYVNLAGFPVTGEAGKIYVALDTNKTYRWSGTVYIYITSGAVDSVAGRTGVVVLTKTDVGLGNIDNTTDLLKPISSATQNALNLKADLASPSLTGTPIAPTATAGTNTTQIATTAFVQTGLATKSPTAGSSSITTLGTISTGVWNGTTIAVANGGTGTATAPIQGGIIYGSSITSYASTAAGTSGYILSSNGTGAPTWTPNDMTSFPSSSFKKSVKVATTTALTINTAVTTIDGIAIAAADRVLVKNQSTSSQNGIYYNLTTTSWIRAVDADTSGEISVAMVAVDSGTAHGGQIFVTSFKSTDTIGTTAMPWYTINTSNGGSISGSMQLDSVGVGTAASGVTGEIRATNTITAFYSDKRLKDNFEVITDALDKIETLTGLTYTQNKLAESFGYNDYSRQVGLIAQDVKKILPEAVKPAPFDINIDGTSKSGEEYLTIQYEKLVPLLVEAIKELRQEINLLKGL